MTQLTTFFGFVQEPAKNVLPKGGQGGEAGE